MKIDRSYIINDEVTGRSRHQFNFRFGEGESVRDFDAWCKKHCKGDWGPRNSKSHWGIGFGWFYDPRDAMLFKLSFS